MKDAQSSFRERFCSRYQVPEAEYETAALKMFLHAPWSFAVPILTRLAPWMLEGDRQILQQLGRVTSGSNFAAEVRDIRTDYLRQNDFGLLRRWFRLRLSRERIFKGSKELWTK